MQAQVQVNLQSALALTRWLARLFMLSVQIAADSDSDSDTRGSEASSELEIIGAAQMLECIDVLCGVLGRGQGGTRGGSGGGGEGADGGGAGGGAV